MTLRREFLLAAAFAACLSACGSSQDADHTELPQLAYAGGELLVSPQVVTVTFANDTLTSQLQAFGASVTSSAWWNEVRPGYCASDGGVCVGDGPPGMSVVLTTSPMASYTDSGQGGTSSLQTWLASEFASGTLPSPGAHSNRVYVIYFPVGDGATPITTVTLDGTTSCMEGGFDGYHNFMAVDGQQIPYAVVMECPPLLPPLPTIPTIDLLQNTTITTSHEVFESSSDPIPPTGFALPLSNLSDLNNLGWNDIVGVEGADLCVDPFGLEQDETTDGVYTVQRIWSNARAAQGIDPCVPAPANEAYFNAAPRSSSFFILGVGASVTFEVDAWSSGPIGDWTLFAQDWSASMSSFLSFSIAGGEDISEAGPQIQVHNGSRIEVTMTLLADPGSLFSGEADGSIVSFSGDPANPTAAHYWPFAVMSPADATDAGIPLSARATPQARVRPGARMHRFGSALQRRIVSRLPWSP
jgi:hypothetical protein